MALVEYFSPHPRLPTPSFVSESDPIKFYPIHVADLPFVNRTPPHRSASPPTTEFPCLNKRPMEVPAPRIKYWCRSSLPHRECCRCGVDRVARLDASPLLHPALQNAQVIPAEPVWRI